MLHPHTELKRINDVIGYGVFATQAIPKGTILWALDPLDQVLTHHPANELEDEFAGALVHFTWTNGTGKRILCWDFGRYMNHSCEANSYGAGGTEFEIAVRDIAPGEELTSDYRTLNLEAPFECQCGSARCTGIVDDVDLESIAAYCDTMISDALPRIHAVEQPLWKWIGDQAWIEDMVRYPHRIPSVVKHRWSPPKLSVAAGNAEGR
jgi:hypothetical protein